MCCQKIGPLLQIKKIVINYRKYECVSLLKADTIDKSMCYLVFTDLNSTRVFPKTLYDGVHIYL